MAMVAADASPEEKVRWFVQPVMLMSTISFILAVFGFVFWRYQIWADDLIVLTEIVGNAINFGLALWFQRRVDIARGRP